MDDMKIECLDEYKDLVMPGIKKGSDERAAASASSEQASSRVLNRRRPSSSSDSSGSSSLDADIFQKLFDGKFHDDELLNESSSNVNRKSRSRLSSFSSCSDDVINELYGQQSSNLKSKRRERLESYDSIDDLGDALMGSTRSPQLAKPTSSNLLQRKQHCDNSRGRAHLKSKIVGKKPLASKAKLSVVVNKKGGGYSFQSGSRVKDSRSSSSSSNFSQIVNKKRPVTIVKAPKPNLKPPVHEPKQDPLHLQDFSDESDTDSYSEFYDDDETDEDDEPKQVIDISTDTSTITSVADTVTPVVSEDEAQQNQHNKNTPQGKNEHLQSYLNNLHSAETPPSKQKRIKRKSRSNEKKSLTPTKAQQPHEAHNQDNKTDDQTLGEAKDQLDEPSSSASKRRLFDEPNNQPSADYVDINLTYEALERLSLNLEEQIMSIDTERSIEFEKRSASKPRSNSSSSKLPGSLIGSSLSVSHVRKLTYSNESLDQLSPFTNQIRRVKSDNSLKRGAGRPRKNRSATTECSKISKDLPKILALQNVPTQCKDSKPQETSQNELTKTPKKRGRPRKHFPVVIEKTDKFEAMQTSNELAPEKLNKSNQSIPQNLNQPNIEDNRGLLENNTTEMKQTEIEEKMLVESTAENEKVIEKNNLVESVEKSLSQQENSNDSFVSAQEEIESQCAPSDLADAEEDTLVEQLHVKAATEEESLTSKGAGKEHEEEPQTCDSAVDRDKEMSAEKCEDETSVGQCIQSVGDNLEQKIETILQDDDLPKANTESVSNDHADCNNLLESSTQDGDETSETNVKSQNSCNQKEESSIEDVNNLKEAEINVANTDNEVDKTLADDVKEICINEPVKDIEAPNVFKELKEDSSCVMSTKSPCPSGRKSRSSKRALKSDVDALVSNEVQRRNSPRLTEKSPAAEKESPAQLKGIGKTKLDKPSSDSQNMATNSKVDNEKVTKEDCLTEAQSQSSNLELEVISTEDTQTSVTTPETEVPVAENLSRKQKSRSAKSKLNNDKPSPRQQKTVLLKSKETELPESNTNAHLLNDPSSSKDQINSTTDNAPPSTDNYTASIPTNSEDRQDTISESMPHLKDTSSDNPDLLTVPKETLIDSITYPTDNSLTPSAKESQENDECKESQLIQTNTEVLTSKDVQDLPISTTETVDIKTGVAIGCDNETLNNMDLSKIGNELGQSISEISMPSRINREMRGLLHDNKEIFNQHLNEDIRSTRLRSQTPNKNKCSSKLLKNNVITKETPGKNGTNKSDKIEMDESPVEPETETETERDDNKLPNTDNLSQEVTMNINNKMETETNATTISSTMRRKCRVRIMRIRLPIYTKIIHTLSIDKSCKTIEKTLEDALVEDMKEHNKTDHIDSAEVVKHSVEEKVEDKKVQLVDQEIDIDVKGKSEEMKDSLDSENEKKSIEEEQQLHSDITYAVKLPKEADHEAEKSTSPSLTETTGVTTSVDNINGDIVDDSQPDEGTKHMKVVQQPMKSKKRNSKKNIMAPPAPPSKRELPSVEGALRKMAKRRKMGKFSGMESKESPLEESVGSRPVSSVIKIKAGKQNQAKKSVQKQSSPMKSALSSLLTDSEPTTVDNSVIITKTAVTTPTIGSYKKQEITSPIASGINISVSVVPEANKQQAEQQSLLSRKPLTQAETVRKMFSLNPSVSPKADVDAVENSAKGSSVKALPAVGTPKKTKGRKPAIDKRVSLPAKLAKSSEELSSELADPTIAGSDKKGVSEKIQGTEELPEVVNSESAQISVPQTQTKHLELDNVPQSKSNKKKSEKTGKKALINDSPLNEETTTSTLEKSLIASASGSREPSNERTKRSYRAIKSTFSKSRATTPVTRATSQSRSTAVATTDPVSSILPRLMDLQPKPQRQSRKNRKKSSDLEQSHSSRKRKLPLTPTAELANVKRAKEDATNADVAFPVRITAASTANVNPSQNIAPAASLELLPVTVPSDQSIPKELSLPPQPLPLKQHKLRVRLNRRIVRVWLEQRQLEAEVVAQQASEPPVVRSQPPPVAPVLPQRQVQRVLPAAKSVPLPVPLPALEVKEEMETEQEEPPAPLAQKEQPSQPRVVDVRAAVQIQPEVFAMAPPISNPNPQHLAISTAASNNSSSNSSGIPSASGTSDSLTFGTTKMFSFLHPSRYQRAYGQVGLDFCCPNLDGPMQAIDPTRLHAKVEVPVLELPQYMVISTKIISKQDKNIPPKVRAKLEQLAAKEGLPCAIQALQTLSTPTAIPTVQTTAVASIAQAVESPVETVNDRLHKPVPSAPMQAQKPQAKVPATTETSSLPAMTKSKAVPCMLQLPTICPTDMLRTELQSRVQLFDVVLQRIARRAAAMSDTERQVVIENIVKTGALLPIDVTVGTKLLESYVYHLDAANKTMTESVTTAAPTSTTTQVVGGKSNSLSMSKSSSSTAVTRQGQQRVAGADVGAAAGGTVPVSTVAAAASDRNPKSRPIYDKDRNIIGYQYKAPKQASDTTAQSLHAPSSKSTLGLTSGVGVASGKKIAHHFRVLVNPPTTQNSKLTTGNAVTTPARAEGVRLVTRAGSGISIPFNPSSAQKTYVKSTANSKLAVAPSSSSSSSSNVRSATNHGSNSNLFIVHQVLSQPEECILPDTDGPSNPGILDAEIKGEIEDVEMC